MRNRTASVSVTIENTASAGGQQTVKLTLAGEPVGEASVELAADETTTETFRLDTGDWHPGTRVGSVTTPADSQRVVIEIQENRTYETFFENISERTANDLGGIHVYSPDRVALLIGENRANLATYIENETVVPATQATALQMAKNPDATPGKVTLFMRTDDGEDVWSSNLTQSLAAGYANGSLTPVEFRTQLWERAVGPLADRADHRLPAYLTWTSGDRARQAYAQTLATRLKNSNWSHHYTVTDYGLYNETVELPDSNQVYGPNASIYVEVQTPREPEQAEYRNFSSTTEGIPLFEVIHIWGNLSNNKSHGEIPQGIYLQYVDGNGTRISTAYIPTVWTQLAVDGSSPQTVNRIHRSVVFSDKLWTDYNKKEN